MLGSATHHKQGERINYGQRTNYHRIGYNARIYRFNGILFFWATYHSTGARKAHVAHYRLLDNEYDHDYQLAFWIFQGVG